MKPSGTVNFNYAPFLRLFTLMIALSLLLLPAAVAHAVDTTPPVTTPSQIMGTYATAQNITLTCSDAGGIGCGSTWYCLGAGCSPATPYSGPVSIASTTSLSFYSTDLDGNSEQVRTYAYTIDPTLTYRFDQLWPQLPQPWYFKNVSGVAVDSSGNVYVADTDNNRIQKFDASGAFVTSWGEYGSNNGQFKYPYGIAVGQGGYVYVADKSNHRIQKFTANGTFVVAWGSSGSGAGQFNSPAGIAVDSDSNVYVADTYNHRVQKFTSNGTFVVAWGAAGNSPGQFASLAGIAVDSFGKIYVADTNNSRIQKFDANGTFLATFGSYGNTNGKFNYPRSITVDSVGSVYVADTNNSRIQKFDSTGTYLSTWGSYGSGIGQLNNPYGISVDPSGNIYVAENNNKRIQKFDSSGNSLGIWTSFGSSDGMFSNPQDCAVDAGGNVYVTDYGNNRIQKFTPGGSLLTSIGTFGNGNGQFSGPTGVTVSSTGTLYVADASRIQKFSSAGLFVTAWGSSGSGDGQFNGLRGISADSSGNIYVADVNNHRIQKFDANGTFLTKWGSNGSGYGQFSYPSSVAVDTNGFVYVADTYNSRIQKFDSNGNFVLSWGSTQSSDLGKFRIPEGVAVDVSGNVYVSDTSNHRIQKFTGNGTFLTAWGAVLFANGSGAGLFSSPKGLALDTVGNVYLVDTGNNRIQKFAPPNLPGLPSAPTGVTAAAGYGEATVSFSAPSSDGGSSVTSYTVTSSPGNITAIGPASPITISGLANNTSSSFTVAATNAGGIGPASTPSNSITPYSIYSLSLTVNGSGTVHSAPNPDLNCTSSCGRSYPGDSVVSLTANASSGYTFMGWSGACSGIDICTVTMNKAQSVGALFVFTGTNGVCGNAHNSQSVDTPASNLCVTGTPSTVGGIGPWNWTCAGSGGGTTASCSAVQAGGVFYRSLDGGNSWTGRVTGIGFNSPINVIAPSPCFDSPPDLTIFIGAGDGAYKSHDAGDSWTKVLSGQAVQALALSPGFCWENTLFAGFLQDGIYKSSDGGAAWSAANSGLPNTQVRALGISPDFTSDQTIFAGILGHGVYKSSNGGATWSDSNTGIPGLTGLSLAISPAYASDRTLFVATTNGQFTNPVYHVYKSVDGGATWTLADTGLAGSIEKIAISPTFTYDQTIFAATSNGIYKSTDSGTSWVMTKTAATQTLLAVSPQYSVDRTAFAGIYGDNVYRSINGGSSWTPSSSNFAAIRQLSAVALSPEYFADNVVFAAAYFAGPQLSVSPGSLTFGNVATGVSSASRQVTITNGQFGDANLAISSITLTGTNSSQYSITAGSCGTLAPILTKGGQCTINVTFSPTVNGSTSATLQINSNALMSPTANIALNGTGISVTSTITSPLPNTAVYGSSAVLTVSGTASCSAGETIALVEISVDGGFTWQPVDGTLAWSKTVNFLQEGTYYIKSRVNTAGGIVESQTGKVGIYFTVDRTPPSGTLYLDNGVWTLNANARDGDACYMVFPSICGILEMSTDGSSWQPATTTPGTGGPLWLRDRVGNTVILNGGTTYNLAVAITGSGTVHSTPTSGINCSGSCSQSYTSGTVVTLTATPGSGYFFSGWSGACNGTGSCSVTMDSAKSIIATFADITPPDTIISSSFMSPSGGTSFGFNFSSTETGSTFECKLNSGSWNSCTSPYSNTLVYAMCATCRTDTPMIFSVRAKDQAGNYDPTPASSNWIFSHPLANPFDSVLDGGEVQLLATDINSAISFTRPITFTLRGGYSSDYLSTAGVTNIHGSIEISAGTVTIENIAILP